MVVHQNAAMLDLFRKVDSLQEESGMSLIEMEMCHA